MATVTKPIALDESINTTEVSPRNVADVLAQELANIATAIVGGGGSGGHTIENSSGTALPQRTNLQFGSGLGVTDDAVNDATVVELTGESVHANMFFKLWENPTPTVAFGAQDIALSSDDYDFLYWEFAFATTVPRSISVISSKGEGVFCECSGAGAQVYVQVRSIVRNSDTSFNVSVCSFQQAGQTATTDNNRMIPLAVYGFKKSLDITAIVSNVSTDARQCMLSDGVTSVEDKINDFEKNTVGTAVMIDSTPYQTTSDGYAEFSRGSTETLWRINGTIAYRLAPITGNTDIFLTYLKKGMTLVRSSGNGVAKFYPLT